MALLYEVDFRTLANLTIGAAGAYTVDGKTWWAKGALNVAGTWTTAIVNGVGLRYRCESGAGSISLGTSGELTARHLFLPLSEIDGWDSSRAYVVRGRFVAASPSAVNPVLGLADTTSDAANLQAAQRAGDFFVGPSPNSSPTNLLVTKIGIGAATNGVVGRTGSIANAECVVGAYHFTPRFGLLGSEHLVSGIPTDPNTFLPLLSVAPSDFNGLRSNPGVFIGSGLHATFSGFALQELRIETVGDLADTTAPQLTIISPPASTVISNVAPVVFELVHDSDLVIQDLWVGFGRTPKSYELAYDGELPVPAFIGNFSGSSKIGNVFTLVRAGGFPYGNRVRLRASVVDSGGNVVVINA